MPDYRVSGEDEEGYLGRTSGYLERKQPKICVGISAVVGRAFLQRSQTVLPPKPLLLLRTSSSASEKSATIKPKNALSLQAKKSLRKIFPKTGQAMNGLAILSH